MSIAPGARLGPYEVLSALGSGGNGEVYHARDPRLGRDVAIKVLPAAFSSDSERLPSGASIGSAGSSSTQYAVAADGRFLMNVAVDDEVLSPITIVLNWQAGLPARETR